MAVGLLDPMVEAAGLPMRVVVARYVRHLRRNKCSTRDIDQVFCYVKFLMAKGEIYRLGEFNEERIDRALGIVAGGGRSPRTVNIYRRCAHSMCEWCLKVARTLDRNLVTAVGRRNEAADTRKVRRSLSIDETRRLLEVCGPRLLFYSVQRGPGSGSPKSGPLSGVTWGWTVIVRASGSVLRPPRPRELMSFAFTLTWQSP